MKTHLKVPAKLIRELRIFAKQRQWSLAETFRRGAELLLEVYPEVSAPKDVEWILPTSSRVGWMGLSHEELRDAAFADADPRLA
jgi:hypothetical protein